MKISFKQFGNAHSWAEVGTSIARSLKKFGHNVHYCSTNGYETFPKDLDENVKCRECTIDLERHPMKCKLDKDYDLALAYTMPLHWGEYTYQAKKRFAIYNFDATELVAGWAKFHNQVNLVLPSSKFSYDTFMRGGIPKNKMVIVPHGYGEEFINRNDKFPLDTDKKYKVLVNIQQPHLRKNIPGMLEAWGRAFSKNDDIAMIAKVRKPSKKANISELDFNDELLKAKKKYPDMADVVVIDKYIDYISDLYRSIDIVLSMSNIECFHLPSLQALASRKINICSNYGGNVDFCNERNSLMVKGKEVRAPKEYFYWKSSVYGAMFEPDINDAADKLRYAYKNYDELTNQFSGQFDYIRDNYTWDNVATTILDLYRAI